MSFPTVAVSAACTVVWNGEQTVWLKLTLTAVDCQASQKQSIPPDQELRCLSGSFSVFWYWPNRNQRQFLSPISVGDLLKCHGLVVFLTYLWPVPQATGLSTSLSSWQWWQGRWRTLTVKKRSGRHSGSLTRYACKCAWVLCRHFLFLLSMLFVTNRKSVCESPRTATATLAQQSCVTWWPTWARSLQTRK